MNEHGKYYRNQERWQLCMDYELHYKLKRGNYKAFRSLYELDLKRLWFICYHITQNVASAAPLLLRSWKAAIETIAGQENAPRDSFSALVSSEIFKSVTEKIEPDEDYASIPIPQISKQYGPYVNAIKQMEYKDRYIYLLTTFGGLNTGVVARLLGISFEETKDVIAKSVSKAQDTQEIKKLGFAHRVRLSTSFKSSNGSPFVNIEVPEFIITTLEHDYQLVMKESGNKTNISRKETDKMNHNTKNNTRKSASKTGFKYTKPLVITAICLVVIIAATIILPKILGGGAVSTRIVTYNVEAVTQGNVTQTISGSGTLTPVTKETLTSSKGGEVEAVNYTVGGAVEEDAVIATINGEDIVAPCDGILLELPIAVGDEVAVGGSVAMVMGKDGFTMGIAVDETEISSVALDQEVTFTIDALGEDYTGKVTEISYNGSSSSGSVAFQITATVDYVEGVYPGMSASAQIVIEDSGEGLLVPVDAVLTSGDNNYIYLAPSDSEEGTVYEEDEIDVSNLTKVSVETGMSDGTYMIIESDEISEGDLIIITNVTSTLTGSDSEGEGGRGGFGGMGGFPGGGGMDFGDFDFENFDPSQMPGGMGGFSGFGG